MAAAEQGAVAYDPATRLREFLKSSAGMWLTPPLPRQLAGSVHAGIVLIFGAIRVLRRPRAARMVVPSMAIAMTRAHLLTRVSILIPATGTVHYECQR